MWGMVKCKLLQYVFLGCKQLYGDLAVKDVTAEPSLKHLSGVEKAQYKMQNFTVQHMQQLQPSEEAVELYKKIRVTGEILQLNDIEQELLIFPDLYPHGFDGPGRRRYFAVDDRDYFYQRVNSFSGKRFREHCQWIMFCEQFRQRKKIASVVYSMVNSGRIDPDLNAKQLLNLIEKDELDPGAMSNHFSKMPQTEEFWNLKRSMGYHTNCITYQEGWGFNCELTEV